MSIVDSIFAPPPPPPEPGITSNTWITQAFAVLGLTFSLLTFLIATGVDKITPPMVVGAGAADGGAGSGGEGAGIGDDRLGDEFDEEYNVNDGVAEDEGAKVPGQVN